MPFLPATRSTRAALILMGPPASGKNRLGDFFAMRGFDVICSGDMIRAQNLHTRPGEFLTAAGRRQKREFLDDQAAAMVAMRVAQSRAPFIVINGFPRRAFHAAALDHLLSGHGFAPENIHVVALRVPQGVLWKRMHKRYREGCEGKGPMRAEDNDATFRRRLYAYWDYSKPVEQYYGDRLIRVYANGAPETVHEKVSNFIGYPVTPQLGRPYNPFARLDV